MRNDTKKQIIERLRKKLAEKRNIKPQTNLTTDYIYLDVEERQRFAQQSHQHLIQQTNHTNFATESIQQTFNNVNFGTNPSVTITRNGDLMTRQYLTVTLPPIVPTPVVPTPVFCVSIVTMVIDVIRQTTIYDIYNYLFT